MKRWLLVFCLLFFCSSVNMTLWAKGSSSNIKLDDAAKEAKKKIKDADGKEDNSQPSADKKGDKPAAPAAEKKEAAPVAALPEWATSGDLVFSSVPAEVLPNKKYVFYLVGDLHHMEYENYKAIVTKFTEKGYVVIANPIQNASYNANYINAIVEEVKSLLNQGVVPANITLLGFSSGGIATIKISALLQNPDINYIIVGGCPKPENRFAFKDDNIVAPVGRFLNIYDRDDEYFGRFTPVFKNIKGSAPRVVQEKRIVSGKGHNFGLEPLNLWVNPALQFIR